MKDSVYDSAKSITEELVMTVSKEDAKFAVEAANGGMTEVALGQLAQQKAFSPAVKEFASLMVKDHSTANEQLKALAKSKGISLPKALSDDNQRLKEKLAAKSGKDFDKAYVDAMTNDHKEDVKTFQYATKSLKDTSLKAFAINTLPVLKMHLNAVEKIHESLNK